MSAPAPISGKLPVRGDPVRGILVPLALLGLAGVLGTDPWHFVSPVAPVAAAPAWATRGICQLPSCWLPLTPSLPLLAREG